MKLALGDFGGNKAFWKVVGASSAYFNVTDEALELESMDKLPDHRERYGLQTLKDFQEVSIKTDVNHSVLYLKPLYEGDDEYYDADHPRFQVMVAQLQPELLARYIAAMFQIPTKVLSPLNASEISANNVTTRLHSEYGYYREYHAAPLTQLFKKYLPKDAFGMLAVTPFSLFLDRYERNRTMRYVSKQLPIVTVSLDDCYEDVREMFAAVTRSVMDLVGFQIPCKWMKGCLLNGADPLGEKPELPSSADFENYAAGRPLWPTVHIPVISKEPSNVFQNDLNLCPICLAKIAAVNPKFDPEKQAKELFGLFYWFSDVNRRFAHEIKPLRRIIHKLDPMVNFTELSADIARKMELS
ncbi:hypothetical protein AAMO2058_000541100 [Amorphochlora amoebiformis]